MDQRGKSLIPLIAILPPTSLVPETQWFARYSSTGARSSLYTDKAIGTPLFKRLVMKYTSSNSMVRSCIPIWNPFSTTFHNPIMYSRRRISFFIFCILKYLRRLQFLNETLDRGLCRVSTSSISCPLYFHSSMLPKSLAINNKIH